MWFSHAFEIIGASGVVGGFIDLWIGKKGQDSVRDWLGTCWLRINDVRLPRLGMEEATFTLNRVSLIFGIKIISARRLVSTIFIVVLIFITSFALPLIYAFLFGCRVEFLFLNDWLTLVFELISSLILLQFSIYVTRILLEATIWQLDHYPLLNIPALLLGVVIQYGLLCSLTWASFTFLYDLSHVLAAVITGSDYVSFGFVDLMTMSADTLFIDGKDFLGELSITKNYNIVSEVHALGSMLAPKDPNVAWNLVILDGHQSEFFLAAIPSLARFAFFIAFLFSYCLNFLFGWVSTLWRRVAENDAPVFTLLFSITSGLAKLIATAITLFYQ